MNLFVPILAIAMVAACHAEDDYTVADGEVTPFNGELVGLLEKFKEKLKNGDDKLGIPVLDPLVMDRAPIDISQEIITMKGELENVYVGGLSEYKPVRGDFMIAGLKINITLLWEEIKLSTMYKINGTFDQDIQVYGDGAISASVKNLTVSVDMQIKVNSTTKKLYLNELVLHVYLDGLKFKITGLYDDPELSETASTIISDIVPGLVRDYQTYISGTASPIVKNVLNSKLSNMTIGDLLGMISGKGLNQIDSPK